MKSMWSVWVVVFVLAMVLAGSGGGQTASSEEELRITYGGQYYPGEFLLYGHPQFWEEYGLEVKHIIFSSGGEGNEALISGVVDANVGADTKTIVLFNAIPEEALIIGTVQRGNRYSTVVREDSPYQSWEDLKGRKVATRFGTGAEGVLRKFYADEGYRWEDFEYVNLKVEDMMAALDRGLIEAFTAWEPTPSIAEAKGLGRIMRSYGDVALVPVCIHTTKDFARANHEVLVRFLAAQLDKAEMIKENPRQAADYAAAAAAEKGIEVAPEAFEGVFERIDFSVEVTPEVIDAIYATAEFMLEQGKIRAMPELAWDDTYYREAQALREKRAEAAREN